MAKAVGKRKRIPSAAGKPIKFKAPATITRKDFFENGSDDVFRDALYRMIQVLSRLVVCREAFGRQIGLTGTQYTILMGVAFRQKENGITIAALASYIGLAPTHVTTEVGRLIRKNLLVKRPNRSDHRSVLISLSPEGERTITYVAQTVRQINDLLFQNIDRKKLDAMNQYFQTLLTNSEYVMTEIRIKGLGTLNRKGR